MPYLAMIASIAQSQTITSSLEGIVKDQSGGAVRGATAKVLNEGTNALARLETDTDGRFFAARLQPGA